MVVLYATYLYLAGFALMLFKFQVDLPLDAESLKAQAHPTMPGGFQALPCTWLRNMQKRKLGACPWMEHLKFVKDAFERPYKPLHTASLTHCISQLIVCLHLRLTSLNAAQVILQRR